MPLYEVILEQSYANQQVINKFTYQTDAVPEGQLGALLVLAGMGLAPYNSIPVFDDGSLASYLALAQVAPLAYVQAIAKNPYSVTDFYTYAFPADTHGQNGGQGLSPINAAGFTSDRTRADIRRAQKRFAGVSEDDVDALGVINADGRTVWEAVGNQLDNIIVLPLVGGGTFTITPYVFGTTPYTTPSGKTAYHLYPTEAEQLAHIAKINQFSLKPDVRSQVSRQYGRGS